MSLEDPLNITPIGEALIDHAIDCAFEKAPELADALLTRYRWRIMLIQGGLEITVDRRTVDGLDVSVPK